MAARQQRPIDIGGGFCHRGRGAGPASQAGMWNNWECNECLQCDRCCAITRGGRCRTIHVAQEQRHSRISQAGIIQNTSHLHPGADATVTSNRRNDVSVYVVYPLWKRSQRGMTMRSRFARLGGCNGYRGNNQQDHELLVIRGHRWSPLAWPLFPTVRLISPPSALTFAGLPYDMMMRAAEFTSVKVRRDFGRCVDRYNP